MRYFKILKPYFGHIAGDVGYSNTARTGCNLLIIVPGRISKSSHAPFVSYVIESDKIKEISVGDYVRLTNKTDDYAIF